MSNNQKPEPYKRNLAVPYFTQRDNTYVWQQIATEIIFNEEAPSKIKYKIGDKFGSKYPMAWRSCNITSLCMLLHYWGITKETPNQMITKVFAKEEWGWSYEANDDDKKEGAARLEKWNTLKEIAKLYITESGQTSFKVHQNEEELTLEKLQEHIAKGFPVILSVGFTSLIGSNETSGHVVVVRGFTNDGDVILNDPFGIPVDNNNLLNTNSSNGNLKGWYYNSPAAAIGDNIVIKKKDFENNFSKSKDHYLYIEGPLWQQPGGSETDIRNSYPIRADNMWHDGIHLESANGFYSIGAGRLVAAKNAEVEGHGSSSFALVKYQLPTTEKQFFYALYMHLKKIDLKQELKDFFLKNNGTVSKNLRGTWYEQIFNNLLPTHVISYYKEESLKREEQEDVYEAEIVDKQIMVKKEDGKPVNAKLDDSNIGIESRHMKYYLLPPNKLEILSDIENYKDMSKLSFMVKQKTTDSEDFFKNDYYYFFCGNSTNRKLCCAKKNTLNINTSYEIYNEASYKYYCQCLYNLYKGETVIFNKIDTTTKNERVEKIKIKNVIDNSVLSYSPRFNNKSKFLLEFTDEKTKSAFLVEHIYGRLKLEIGKINEFIEYLIVVNAETSKSADVKVLEKYIGDFKTEREAQLKKILQNITSKIDKNNAIIGGIEKKTDIEWTKELFEDAETKLNCEKVIGKKSVYDTAKGMVVMQEIFAKMVEEYRKVDVVSSIAICEYLMIAFAIILKKNIFEQIHKLWTDSINEVKKIYSIFFKIRYIDTYIEVPKGAKIGDGSKIPDAEKDNSIHFEVFSKENLFPCGIVVKDEDNNTFYSPRVITSTIISALNLPDEEKKQFFKYSDDNVITTDEIAKLYKETDYFKKMVTYHRSEWKTEKYKEEDIKAITNKNKKLKDEIINTLDYYNNYYNKYNWLDSKMEKILDDEKFYFYHPTTFINFLYSELTNKYILNIYSFSSISSDEQYRLLNSIVNDENLLPEEKGILSTELRKERNNLKLEELFKKDEKFMNENMRDFLNLKEDGTMNYDMNEIKKNIDWKKMSFVGSLYHQNSINNGFNSKYVNTDGREVVFNANGQMINEYPDKGTYNYSNGTIYSTLFGEHKKYDIKPFNHLIKEGF